MNEALSFCNSNTKVAFKYTANNCPPFFVLDFFSAYSTKSDIFIGLPRKKLSVELSLDSAFNVISDVDIFPMKIQKQLSETYSGLCQTLPMIFFVETVNYFMMAVPII